MRWWPRPSRLVVLAAIGAVTAVSGCGAERGAGESASGSAPASASATWATPHTSAGTSAQPEPAGGSGSPVPVTKGAVSVTLDADHYPVGAVIRATVANGLDRAVYTEDFKTACSIVTLQHRDGDAWTDIVGCRLGRPTATVPIGPGLGHAIELDPSSFHLADDTGGSAFGAGLYRVTFTYRLESAVGGEDPLTAYSAEFAIR